jgi:peptidylprolyl isomerase
MRILTIAAAFMCAAAVSSTAVAQTTRPAIGPADLNSAADSWRIVDPENALVIDTTKGRIIVEFAPEIAPNHVVRIKELARSGFYNGIIFHRVIDNFMAQTGDPTGTGEGDSDKPNVDGEFNFRRGADFPFAPAVSRSGVNLGWVNTIPVTSQADFLMARTVDRKVTAWGNFCPGVAGMARSSELNSANSQFFLMRGAYPSLDRNYTVWGRVVIGLDIVRSIQLGEPPTNPDRMVRVAVLADLPAAERPRVRVQRVDGPAFQQRLATAMATDGATFSNCDLIPRGEIVQ